MSCGLGLRSLAVRRCVLLVALCSAALGAVRAPCRAAPIPAAGPAFGHAMLVQRDGAPALSVDGRPFFFWGGAFFYERIPAERWRASMLAMRALGANTLDLYVPWNWHELSEGDFDFEGRTDARRNLRALLRLGRELGFHFIVRPGPVIRNEWRNGGYPSWLLTRAEYDMPLHDVLEGRYPATATLQNARSDDAAAEWMRNATHLRYASRWLHRALDEFRPYADLVVAVQLDDDQGAYIDNQTYPAPNFQRYLAWLEQQVRDVIGPVTPTFINTYQMRVPASSPVWTMGNWYQSDAYRVAEHDRVELDFSTLLLATNRRGPPAQSEFQAGWLAGPEDPQPRPADPRNTTLALDELLALGVKGVVDFPMQDTFAEPGWEAPFSNAAYAWDAAIPYDLIAGAPPEQGYAERFSPTEEFGALVRALAPVLTAAHRVAEIAIAYGEPPPRDDSRPPDGTGAIVAAVRAALAECIRRGLTCDIVDVRRPPPDAIYRTVVVSPQLAAAAADAVTALRARLPRARFVAGVPQREGTGVTLLRGSLGDLRIATNWTAQARRVRFGRRVSVLAPGAGAVRIAALALAALGAPANAARISSDDCDVAPVSPFDASQGLTLRSDAGCSVAIARGAHTTTVRLAGDEQLTLPDLRRRQRLGARRSVVPSFGWDARLAPRLPIAVRDGGDPAGDAAVAREIRALSGVDGDQIVLRNDRLRVVLSPSAGARAFLLQAFDAGRRRWSPNAFDATGGWRDDVSAPLAASPRDYIARYTHAYPAGTFNRAYRTEILESGPRARVRLTYTMPDTEPAGTTFERLISLEPRASRVTVDERLMLPPGAVSAQRAVVRSSLPVFARDTAGAPQGVALDEIARDAAGDLAAGQNAIASYREGFAFVVAWRSGDVEHATWTPYRSTGTLALTLAPGPRRVVYAAAAAADAGAARRIVEAERAWAAANPAPGPTARGSGETVYAVASKATE